VKVTLLDTSHDEEWDRALARLPGADVYFTAGYHAAHERNGDGRAYAYLAEDDGGALLFYPFFLRPVEAVAGEPVTEDWTDIETVYGYSGPLATSEDEAFLERAWAGFDRWCGERGVVAEFTRFNPLSHNCGFRSPDCALRRDRETVALSLAGSEDELWARYPSTQRNMVRKALAHGLVAGEAPVAAGLADFTHLYGGTMRRVGARSYYSFSPAYFAALAGALGETLRIFVVRDGPTAVAAALFLRHGDRLHYHLAGSDPAYRAAAANNLLLHGAALWGRERGLRHLHLGGGRTADADDALFRFKASVGRQRLPFQVGTRVHDEAAYAVLCDRWRRRHGDAVAPTYFLLYRLEDAA
jgi:Acetyltransferase (GNAT) domain